MAVDPTKLVLPSVSPEGMAVLDIVSREEPDLKELEQVIMRDPVLASTIIKYANSPLYRRTKNITSIPNAIRMLGLKNIRSAVAMATMQAFASDGNPVNQAILGHCLDTAFLCKEISRRLYPKISDEMEFIGLIHDMGMLVLSNSFPDDYKKIYQNSIEDGQSLNVMEKETFEIQHDEIMAIIAPKFCLPEHLIELLQSYHAHPAVFSLKEDQHWYLSILDIAHHIWMRTPGDQHRFHEKIADPLSKLKGRLKLDDKQIEELANDSQAVAGQIV